MPHVDVPGGGTYVLRVYGFLTATNDYLGTVTITATEALFQTGFCLEQHPLLTPVIEHDQAGPVGQMLDDL